MSTSSSSKANSSTQNQSKQAAAGREPRKENSSKQATKIAKKGDPLPAESQKDRSPKQENL